MNKTEIEKMETIGFFLTDTSSYLDSDSLWLSTKEVNSNDRCRAIGQLYPNHFSPTFNRGAFVAHMYEGTDKDFWYITSNLRGNYRGYRCRTTISDFDTCNVLGSGKSLEQAVDKFVEEYKNQIRDTA